MDMSMVEKRRVLKVKQARRKSASFAMSVALVVCAFIALFTVINSDLNVAKNPSIGSFVVSATVCGFLFASILSFLDKHK